jgi:acyl-CoA dehydrogenase
MDFVRSERSATLGERLEEFMRVRVIPAEKVYLEQISSLPSRYDEPPIMADLKAEARSAGLWNLFMPDDRWGPGLSTVEYAPLAETMGRSLIGPEVFNCSAPDTGNMEVLATFGTAQQQMRWLTGLLAGSIRSSFLMTEPDVASSDATNIGSTIVRDGDEYVLNGRKWFITNGPRPQTRIGLFMGVSDPGAPRHQRHSIILMPMDSPGVTVERALTVFGYGEGDGHAEVTVDNVRVPVGDLLASEGDGFRIAQSRLGPGRIHHCMRALGQAERALELMCERAESRSTFGRPLVDHDLIRRYIARSRIEIDQARLYTLHAAWLIDTVGSRDARSEISAIKVAVPKVAVDVIDRAIQVFGAAGVSQDTPLAQHWAHARTLRIVDGPDEVHLLTVAKLEVNRRRAHRA